MTCPRCGHANRDGAKFCDDCGQKLAVAENVPAPLARRILAEHATMKGERRVVTCLFADAVGSTNIGERLDEEKVYDIVQHSVARMRDAVYLHEGTITQFRGDGVMALFGAPIAHEDSARRAVLAGLDMQKRLADYAVDVRAQYGIELAFRVGLHTGPVVVGAISESLVMDYTAVGDTANLAARMEALAEPGTVYLTEDTWRQVRDYIDCDALGPRTVKGKAEPVQVFRARSERAARTRMEVALERGLSPFTGRGGELARLTTKLDRARAGEGGALLLVGEAGLGKSRLLRELSAASDASWLEGRCSSVGRVTPWLPILDIVRQALGIRESDDDLAVRKKVAGPDELFLRFLLQRADEAIDRLDPLARQMGVVEAVTALLTRQSQQHPLIVVLEDLHWIDEQSERLLTRLVEVAPEHPILVLATARPEYKLPFGGAEVIELAPLADADSLRIASAVFVANAFPDDVKALVLEKAEGNPFYVEEFTRSLVESGTTPDGLRLPLTIQEVILSRIDRLDRSVRDVIQLASVIGREFSEEIIGRVAGVPLGPALRALEASDLVHRTGERTYMFKHALTLDVAYGTLLADRRHVLHEAVGVAMEAVHAEHLDEHWGALAHHFEAALDDERALPYLLLAAERASASAANRVASDLWDRAVRGAERLDRKPDLVTALFGRGFARLVLAQMKDAWGDLERARSLAEAIGDHDSAARALLYVGLIGIYGGGPDPEATLQKVLTLADDSMKNVVGTAHALLAITLSRAGPERHAEAETHLAQATALRDHIREPPGRAYILMMNVLTCVWRGRFGEAQAMAEVLIPEERRGLAAFQNYIRWLQAVVSAGNGDYATAFKELGDARAACERFGDQLVLGRCLNTLGWIHHDLGDVEGSEALNRRALEVTPSQELEVTCNGRLNLADALLAQGRLAEADRELGWVEDTIHTATGHHRKMMWRYGQHLAHARGALRLAEGRLAEATDYADRCLDLAERSASAKYIAMGRRLKALARLAAGEIEEADALIGSALAVAREVANPPQLWRTLAAMARVREAHGDGGGAAVLRGEGLEVLEKVARTLEPALATQLRASPMALELRG